MTRAALRSLIIAAALGFSPGAEAAGELRGTWLARDSFASKGALAAAMETLAANNFNVVYVNAWSRGYPLWRSGVFERYTGIAVDPGFGGRDILAEAVVEGHRVGLEVEAWFEYGFVGGWDGYFPGRFGKGVIFDGRPEWLARSVSGSDAYPIAGGGIYYWMAHSRPDVQQFLIDLVVEVATRYDVDGIEFDRARYPSTDCGYDELTRTLFLAETGREPPSAPNDASWMRWRADKINGFIAALYRSVKRLRPEITVSNAPVPYPFGYTNFLQDYPGWLSLDALDLVTPQVYRNTDAEYVAELERQAAQIGAARAARLLYPGLKTNDIPASEVVAMVRSTRARGYKGAVHWYYGSLAGAFASLKAQVYQEKAEVPYRTADWPRHVLLLDESAADAEKSGFWSGRAGGWEGAALSAAGGTDAAIRYNFTAPQTGWYEVHAWTEPAPGNSLAARYTLRDSRGRELSAEVNQRSALSERWSRLGVVYLAQGQRQTVATLSAEPSAAGAPVIADAIMLVRTHLEPESASAGYQLQKNGSARLVLEDRGALQSGHAAIEAESGEAPDGMALFRARSAGSGGDLASVAGVPASIPLRGAAMFAEIGDSVNSGVAFSNPGEAPATLRLVLRDAMGEVVATPEPIPLAARRQLARFVGELLPAGIARPFSGSLWISADAPVATVTLRGSVNPRGEFLLTTMPQADTDRPETPGVRVYPQVADGGGYTTQLWLLNTTGRAQAGTISLFSPEGGPLQFVIGGQTLSSWPYTLPPRGIFRWSTEGAAPTVRTGYAVIAPDAGQGLPLGSVVFSFVQPGGTRTELGVPATAPRREFRFCVRRSSEGGIVENPGVAVANHGPLEAKLKWTLFAPDGVRVLARAETALAAGAQSSRFLGQWLGSGPEVYDGALLLESDQAVACLVLQGFTNRRGDFLLGAVASADPDAGAALRVFPQVAAGEGYSTDIILLSGRDAALRGRIRWLQSGGDPWILQPSR